MKKSELPTPAVVIDVDILQKNIQIMADTARKAEIKLRPHIKTHKMPVIAKMQMEAGAVGVTCAKVSEAEVMVQAGIKDILIAFPVVGQAQIDRIMKLAEDCKVTIAFDSEYGAQRIHEAAKLKGKIADLYMIINTGANRDGVLPGEEALALAKQTSHLDHVRIRGIMTHEGHVYQAQDLEHLRDITLEAGRKMVETAELLRTHGFPVEEVSMGSTPACRLGIAAEGVTEWRPGTYVFNDVHEFLLATPMEECALSILGTVVSHPASNRFILDSGSKTLTADKPMTKGYGYIKEAPSALIERLSEEHGVVSYEDPNGLRIGQRVEIIPNHVCPVINLMDKVYVVRGEDVVDQWVVEARGKII
jgi:D-serine deaminase-like pyridoxal phosphate-dependent protein